MMALVAHRHGQFELLPFYLSGVNIGLSRQDIINWGKVELSSRTQRKTEILGMAISRR